MTSETAPTPAASAAGTRMWVPNLTVFIGGMCIMVAELVAGRLISRYLGQSLYTWTSCIGVFLTGISIGNYLGGRLADAGRPRPTLAVLFLIAAASCLTIPLLNRLANDWPLLWEQSWPVRIFIHVTLTFIFPAIMLGTIGPVAAKMALTEVPMKTGRIIGQVYAWGAVGSIVGTYLTGFYLVAAMGSVAVIATVAAILAIMGLAYAASSWAVRGSAAAILLAASSCFLPIGPLQALGSVLALCEKSDPEVLYSDESQYGYIRVESVGGDPNTRVMILDKLMHSIGDMRDAGKLLYDYYWVYEAIMEQLVPRPQAVRAFFIGGGGYSYPKYLEHVRPGSYMEVTEIDPAVTESAFRAFGLSPGTTARIFNVDARERTMKLIQRMDAGAEVETFDFFLGDSFNDYAVPYHLTTREFTQQVYRLLNERGVYLLNFIDYVKGGVFAGSLVKTCREVFPFVGLIEVDGMGARRSTFVLVCAKQPIALEGLDERIRQKYAFRGSVMPEADVARMVERGVTLTDDYAPVENLLAAFAVGENDQAVQRYVDEGIDEAKSGRLDRAEALFRRAMALDPTASRSYYNLALVMLQKGNIPEAGPLLEQTVHMDPYMTEARSVLAQLYADVGRIPEAIGQWTICLKSSPDNSGYLSNLGTAHLTLGSLDEAWPFLERALAIHPDDVNALNSAGILWDRKGDGAKALGYYLRSIAVDHGIPETHYNAALILLREGRTAEARGHLEKALALNPEFSAAREMLSRLPAGGPAS